MHCDELKLPEVPKNSLHIPKTYSTKRGALLLYSERSFVPGSRRLKKRPRFKRQKETRLETMKDLMQVIMDYKRNGVDECLYLHYIFLNPSNCDNFVLFFSVTLYYWNNSGDV
jgi:hypothetical protein